MEHAEPRLGVHLCAIGRDAVVALDEQDVAGCDGALFVGEVPRLVGEQRRVVHRQLDVADAVVVVLVDDLFRLQIEVGWDPDDDGGLRLRRCHVGRGEHRAEHENCAHGPRVSRPLQLVHHVAEEKDRPRDDDLARETPCVRKRRAGRGFHRDGEPRISAAAQLGERRRLARPWRSRRAS